MYGLGTGRADRLSGRVHPRVRVRVRARVRDNVVMVTSGEPDSGFDGPAFFAQLDGDTRREAAREQ